MHTAIPSYMFCSTLFQTDIPSRAHTPSLLVILFIVIQIAVPSMLLHTLLCSGIIHALSCSFSCTFSLTDPLLHSDILAHHHALTCTLNLAHTNNHSLPPSYSLTRYNTLLHTGILFHTVGSLNVSHLHVLSDDFLMLSLIHNFILSHTIILCLAQAYSLSPRKGQMESFIQEKRIDIRKSICYLHKLVAGAAQQVSYKETKLVHHLFIFYYEAAFCVENTVQTASHYWFWPCCNSKQFDIERPGVILLQSCCWCCVSEGLRWGLAIDLWLSGFTSGADKSYVLWRREERALTVMYFFKNQLWRRLMSYEGSSYWIISKKEIGFG